jgi:hypothetical protein
MRTMDETAQLQVIEIFADSDLRYLEGTGEVAYQDSALFLDEFQNVLPALVDEHLGRGDNFRDIRFLVSPHWNCPRVRPAQRIADPINERRRKRYCGP